ncbi:hypothetical protein M436DRAFT_85137 [Aureobasidium namibiae CBS 147.97]|uniref:Uncharacterized protein n=1 Tax=Aureobasidium namibiae CBS 147.97 TaxID=1043004 RepID=A0A074WIP4_9PEZI
MSHPAISVNIALEPAAATIGAPCSITLSVTLSHPTPITIHTWHTVFNYARSKVRRNFWCIDLSDNDKPVQLETVKCGMRSGYICRELGGLDDQYFVTLEPGKVVEFTAPFILAHRVDNRLVVGHRYRFGLSERECVQYWMHGTREEIMLPPGQHAPIENAGPAIMLDAGSPVEFEVLDPEPLEQEPQQVSTSTQSSSRSLNNTSSFSSSSVHGHALTDPGARDEKLNCTPSVFRNTHSATIKVSPKCPAAGHGAAMVSNGKALCSGTRKAENRK